MKNTDVITATGIQPPVALNNTPIITFASVGDAADYTLIAEVQLVDGGDWYPMQTMVDNSPNSAQSNILNFRYNCTSLGSATTINADVYGQEYQFR